LSCIFFDGKICLAEPRTIKKVRLHRPSKAHRRQFCETPGYDGCPRFVEYVTYLKEEVEEQRS